MKVEYELLLQMLQILQRQEQKELQVETEPEYVRHFDCEEGEEEEEEGEEPTGEIEVGTRMAEKYVSKRGK